jgi:uncharacterized protein YneR
MKPDLLSPEKQLKRINAPHSTITGSKPFYLLSFVFYLVFCTAPLALSQIPQGFNYQALALDGSDHPISSQTIRVMLTVQSDTLGGTIYWKELHSGIVTSLNGMFSLVVGKGVKQDGIAPSFGEIDWNTGVKWLKTEIDHGGWNTMGSSRLWSVPYALVAGDIRGSLKKLEVAGETTAPDEALFEVRNKSGQTVFAVYNEGVRIYVGDGESKSVKGGFAIGGFDTTKALRDLLVVNSDCVRVYIDNNDAKAVKGGFAIGGFDEVKAPAQEFLRVTDDSIRMYISNNPTKSVKGGFAIGSFDETKGDVISSFTSLTPENYFIGHGSGEAITSGKYNSFLGYEAGKLTETGSENIFIGYQSGYSNVYGKWNTFLGFQSGTKNTGSDNTFIGYQAGSMHQSQGGNVYIGSKAGQLATNGQQNVLIGEWVGANITTGSRNIMMGVEAGVNNRMGNDNVFLGHRSGYSNLGGGADLEAGFYNVFIGAQSGTSNTSGKRNVYIGYDAGKADTSGFDNVYIGYSSASQAIGGPVYRNYRMVAVGSFAADNLNGAGSCTFVGWSSGRYTTIGHSNSFYGYESGLKNESGVENTYIGTYAGKEAVSANYNTYVGSSAGISNKGQYNTIMGSMAGALMTAVTTIH